MPNEASVSLSGSWVAPDLEHARVADAMRAGVLTCPKDATLRQVARTMATNHVHSVIVSDIGPAGESWGIVSDLDLVRAAISGSGADDVTAGAIAGTEVVTVKREETLERAAQLMIEHDTAHLIVVDAETKAPIGVISTLDVAGVAAWGNA